MKNNLLYPYLAFKGEAREAMEFYHGIFGGKLDIVKFSDIPETMQHPGDAAKVMHSALNAGDISFMACDTPTGVDHHPGTNITLAISGTGDEKRLAGYFTKLAKGGTITQPLEDAPWGSKFGMLTDKYGIQWMVDIGPKEAA